MIKADQPVCFPDAVVASVSSEADGQMQHGWKESDKKVTKNRKKFLGKHKLGLDDATLVRVQYADNATYDVIREITPDEKGIGMQEKAGDVADCLITTIPGTTLFLPIADCIGTVVYDPAHQVLAVAHLGRHSTIASLAGKLIGYLQKQHNSDPTDLIVWMAPSIHAPHYVLEQADFAKGKPRWQAYCTAVEGGYSLDMQGYNQNQFEVAGVPANNIHISPVDTATNPEYWSHYTETTLNKKSPPPRFALIAALQA